MKLAKAMLIAGAMTAVSASIGAAALPILATHVSGATTEAAGGEDKTRWSPPEPATKSLVAPAVAGLPAGVDPGTVLLLAGLLRL